MAWEALAWVSGPFGLLAFITAVLARYASHRCAERRRELAQLPDSDRLKALQAHFGYVVQVDLSNLTIPEKAALANSQIASAERKSQRIFVLSLCLAVLSFIVLISAILSVSASDAKRATIERNERAVARENTLALLIADREEAQQKLDLLTVKANQLVGEVRGFVAIIAISNAKLESERIADSLRAALGRFEAAIGDSPLSPEEQFEANLARATIANADKRYQDALALVTELDVEHQRALTDAQVKREIDSCRIRGNGLIGLSEWDKARACFHRIVFLRPRDIAAHEALAFCLAKLNRYREAGHHFDKVISELDLLPNAIDTNETISLRKATALNNRGVVYLSMSAAIAAKELFNEALACNKTQLETSKTAKILVEKAKTLLNRASATAYLRELELSSKDLESAITCLKQAQKLEPSLDLVSPQIVVARGELRRLSGDYVGAIADLDRAIDDYKSLLEKHNSAMSAEPLAWFHALRGNVYLLKGEVDKALIDFEFATSRFERFVQKEGRIDLREELAMCYLGKGTSLSDQGNVAGRSILTLSVNLFADLVKNDERPDLSLNFITAINNRAVLILRRLLRPNEAIAELDMCFSQLAATPIIPANPQRREVEAQLFSSRAMAYRAIGAFSKAKKDIDKAIDIRTALLRDYPNGDYASLIASSHYLRATLLFEMQKWNAAEMDLERSMERQRGLVANGGHALLQNDLALSLRFRAFCFDKAGNLQAALDHISEAIDIQKRLVQEEETSALTLDLADSYDAQGVRLSQASRSKSAVASLDEAIRLKRKLLRPDGTRVDVSLGLANSFVTRGVAKARDKRVTLESADDDLKAGIGLFLELIKTLPAAARVGFGDSFARGLTAHAQVLMQQKRSKEARTYLRKALMFAVDKESKSRIARRLARLI